MDLNKNSLYRGVMVMKLDLKIPDIARGAVVPSKVEMDILKNEQERKEMKRRDRIAVYTLIVSALTLIVSIIALIK